jgi:hypothetical protein
MFSVYANDLLFPLWTTQVSFSHLAIYLCLIFTSMGLLAECLMRLQQWILMIHSWIWTIFELVSQSMSSVCRQMIRRNWYLPSGKKYFILESCYVCEICLYYLVTTINSMNMSYMCHFSHVLAHWAIIRYLIFVHSPVFVCYYSYIGQSLHIGILGL